MPLVKQALWRLTGLDPAAAYQPDDNLKPVHERLVFVPAVTRTFTRMIAGKKAGRPRAP